MSLLTPRALPGAVKLSNKSFSEPHIHRLVQQLIGMVERHGRPDLVLDLGDVSHLNGMGLGKLVLLHKTLQRRGVRMTLIELEPHIYEVFSITRLHRVLAVRAKQAG